MRNVGVIYVTSAMWEMGYQPHVSIFFEQKTVSMKHHTFDQSSWLRCIIPKGVSGTAVSNFIFFSCPLIIFKCTTIFFLSCVSLVFGIGEKSGNTAAEV